MKSICPGCAIELDAIEGAIDPYGASSPACWAAWGEVSVREISGANLVTPHRLSVDVYMSQHPSRASRAAVQSVWLHLVGLCLALERDAAPKYVGRTLARLAKPKTDFAWLAPPPLGGVTVADVLAAPEADHPAAVRRWAEHVWRAWSPHHAAIRDLLARNPD